MEPVFLQLEDALYFHKMEMTRSKGTKEIRDLKALEAALNAPKATFEGKFLMNIFEMAATYVQSVCTRHPFLDGNKRVAALCAVVFLHINGYEFSENHDEELAEQILALVTRKMKKAKLARYFKDNSEKLN